MPQRSIFLLAGQGSQYYQMGKALYESDACFRYWMDEQDHMYQGFAGFSVVAHLYDPAHRKSMLFQRLSATHPAIFMVEYALGQSLIEQGRSPACLLGVSLGELVAFTLSGALLLEPALAVVYQEATLVERDCERCKMYVLFKDVAFFYGEPNLYNCAELVGVNNASQLVIATEENRAVEMEAYFQSHGIRWMEVPTTFGFHTSKIEAVKEKLRRVYANLSVHETRTPVFSARTCTPVTLTEDNQAAHLWQRIREPFYLERALLALMRGYPTHPLVDVSANSMFRTQLKLIQPVLEPAIDSFLSPFK